MTPEEQKEENLATIERIQRAISAQVSDKSAVQLKHEAAIDIGKEVAASVERMGAEQNAKVQRKEASQKALEARRAKASAKQKPSGEVDDA